MRIGIGYDLHKLVKGRKLILGGVQIDYKLGLFGHSDADVLVHAIMDALLGSLALRDIGHYFPDTDPKFKDADSMVLLVEVMDMLKGKGYKVINIDSIIIAEEPKLNPYIPLMKANLAKILGVGIDCSGIKATTNEGLGDIGLQKAIAAKAVVLVDKIGG